METITLTLTEDKDSELSLPELQRMFSVLEEHYSNMVVEKAFESMLKVHTPYSFDDIVAEMEAIKEQDINDTIACLKKESKACIALSDNNFEYGTIVMARNTVSEDWRAIVFISKFSRNHPEWCIGVPESYYHEFSNDEPVELKVYKQVREVHSVDRQLADVYDNMGVYWDDDDYTFMEMMQDGRGN